MEHPKVFVSLNMCEVGFDLLRERGCEIIMIGKRDKEVVKKQIKGVDAVVWSPLFRLDKEMLDAAGPQMKVVGIHSAGYNHIDVEECRRRGVKLANLSSVTDYAVADTAVLLLLAASRRLHEGRIAIEKGQWFKHNSFLLGHGLKESTVGIVGLGGIGQATVRRLKCFNVGQFLYTGHREKPEGKELDANFVSLDTLLELSDFVIISVPLTEETKQMCNRNFFSKMKKNAVFVNISRGLVVKQDDLIEALKNKVIFAAGLDVMTPEPLPSDHELLKLPNVVLSPHLGNATISARDSMARMVAENVIRGLNGEEMLTPI